MTTVSSSFFGLQDSSCPGKDLAGWSWLNNSSCERSDRTERSPCEHQPCPPGDSSPLSQVHQHTLEDLEKLVCLSTKESIHILVLLVILLVCL